MKRYIFSLQVTGLGDTEDEARQDAVHELLGDFVSGLHKDDLNLVKVEDVEEWPSI